MAGRAFGGFGPTVIPPHVSSRIVPGPGQGSPFDVRASLDRIRAAQAAAMESQRQSQEDKDALESANMGMNADSNLAHEASGAVPAMQAAQGMRLTTPVVSDEDAAMHRSEMYRAPGALSQEQQAQQLADTRGQREAEKAWAQSQRNKKEDEAKSKQDWDNAWSLDTLEQQVNEDVRRPIDQAVKDALPAWDEPIIAVDRQAEAENARTGQLEQDSAMLSADVDRVDLDNSILENDGTEPTDAPLPGEEALPPSIARWNSLRATQGMGGLGRLQRRYMAEVPEGSRGTMNFETWLGTKGVNAETPYEVARGRLNQIADTKDATDSKGNPIQARTNTEVYARKKKQFLDRAAERFARELANGEITMADIERSYDSGVSDGTTDNDGNALNDPALAGARGANRMALDNLRRKQKAQIAVNWKNRQDQMGKASTWGMPLAQVQFFDSLQQAQTPQETANVLMLAHQANPNMGWDKAAALLMKGGLDQASIQAWAANQGGPKGVDKFGNDLNSIQTGPIDGTTLPRLRMAIEGSIKEGTPPEEAKKIHLRAQQPIAQRILDKQEPPSDPEMLVLRQITEGMDAQQFFNFTDLDPRDPRSQAIYKEVFGVAPPSGFWSGLGDMASGVGEFFGGLFGSETPGPAAWADQAGTGNK